jgi:hypothetical protein
MKLGRGLGCIGLACVASASAATWQGTVFNDANRNGHRDPGETGIADVAVSNGAAVVRTDTTGHYSIEGDGDGFLFVVKPRNWSVPLGAQNLPQSYRRLSEVGLPRPGGRDEDPPNPGRVIDPALPLNQTADGRGQMPAAGGSSLSSALLPLSSATVDFPLLPAPEPDRFRILVFADTQVGSEKEVGYLERTIIDPIVGGNAQRSTLNAQRSSVGTQNPELKTQNPESYALGITLGDVVNDRPELYDALNRAIARIGVPWYPLIGNHDLDLGAMQDRGSAATFEAKYGPSTHAFQYGQVLFVALNNVRYQGGLRYLGGLTDGQFGFIGQLLAGTPRETLVVVMMHIPWFFNDPANNVTFRMADRARLFGLLAGRPNLLLLSGHSHYQRHVFYTAAEGWTGATPLHEYNVAAASGGFWGGPPDASGIPIATQWDGTPHGYAILSFDGTKPPQLDYRAARKAPDDQIGLWGPAVVALKQGFVSFYANVYNGHEGWKIEARVDDRIFNPMRKVVDWDPAYAAQYLAQDAGPNPSPSPRLPDPLVNYHLWRAYLPSDLVEGTHTIEVRATDPAGMIYTAKRGVIIR